MVIDLWRTTKRENSTATPVSEPGWFTNHIQKEVKLKEQTSVLEPSFTLRMSGHDGQNYVWAFGRYYWVTNIISLANNLWEIQCKIDPLGSYRGHIRNTTAYVLYDSTPNTEIPDRRLGVRTTPTMSQATAQMPWGFASGTGTKFVAIDGDGQNSDGASATGVYTMTDAAINDLGFDFADDFIETFVDTALNGSLGNGLGSWQDNYDEMQNNPPSDLLTYIIQSVFLAVLGIIALVNGLVTALKGWFTSGDCLKHIKAAYWLPFDCSDEGTSVSKIALGGWIEEISAKKITSPFKTTVVNVGIPWQYSDWRNVSNTEIQLFIPLIGNVNIPASAVKGHTNLTVKMTLNMYSGAFSVRVQCGDATLGSFGSNCQMPIMIGSSNANAPAIVNTIAAGATIAAGVATGGATIAATGVAAAIATGFESLTPINTSVGGIGGGAGNQLGIVVVCTTICHNTSDAPSDLLPIIGTPTNVLKQLTGSGFCQTLQAHMSMTAVTGESYPTEEEVQRVNRALDSGVFLE